jgi:putative PIN family toxin of toxin-antitoxin system
VIRAVIDTNVLVSGLLSPAGNEALIVLAMHQGLIRPCFSEAVMQEYAEVLTRPKFGFEPDAIAAVLAMMRGNGERAAPQTVARDLPDPMTRSSWTAPRQRRPNILSPATNGIFRRRLVGQCVS